MNTGTHNGIAIIGMAGRFPKARNVQQFWNNLCEGREGISLFTTDELRQAGVNVPDQNPNYVKARGILEGADLFDAAFFGINPREAEIMDPQHRVFLECAWEALENAGYNPEKFAGAIGVFAGMSMNTYLGHNLAGQIEALGGEYQAMLGNDKDFLPTRVSYKLNLKGPSLNIQTACSTSLVAVCVACQNLLNYECDMALAGAVSISFPQKKGYLYQEGGIASPDGHCRAFDAKAAGTVAGEGTGIVVLKRLEDALGDGDQIYAVIKGFALNNDGSLKVGYTAPSVDGQAEVIATAQAMADFSPDSITFIEAHGTGTPLGDPIEVAGLKKAFGINGSKKFCAIGSVKSNIGHLDTAAGVAGLIKTALALHSKQLPPSLHFENPNPKLELESSPFFISNQLREWPAGNGPRRAGVSSFGIGGTNAHVVLEEAPLAEKPSGDARAVHLLTFSAKTDSALKQAAVNFAEHLEQNPALNLADAAYTLRFGRHDFAHRRILVCRSAAEAISKLRSENPAATALGTSAEQNAPVVFMFPGQGAQRVNMGRELYESEKVFRDEIDNCCELLRPQLGLDLRDILYPRPDQLEAARGQLRQTALTQPAMFVIEYALAKLWMHWGIQPEAMIGHSLGEYVAACLSGVFSLPDALKLVATRGRMIQQLPAGSMLAVRLSELELKPLLKEPLSLASLNGEKLCVASGPNESIEELERHLSQKGVACTRLETSHAFHSGMLDSIVNPFVQFVAALKPKAPKVPYLSNVTGTWITAEQTTDPQYWGKHLRHCVRFADGIAEIGQRPERILLEVGPGQTLTNLARQHPRKPASATCLPSLGKGETGHSELETLMTSLGSLWVKGVQVDWTRFFSEQQRQRVPLPTYPFERRRFWIEPRAQAIAAPETRPQLRAATAASNGHSATDTARVEQASPSPRFNTVLSNGVGGARKDRIIATLRSLLTDLSGLDLSQANPRQTFTEIGFESLFLTQASLAVEKALGVRVAFRQLLEEANSLEGLAKYIDKQLPAEQQSATQGPDNTPASVSSDRLAPSETLNQSGNGTSRTSDQEQTARASSVQYPGISELIDLQNVAVAEDKHQIQIKDLRADARLEGQLKSLCSGYICDYFKSCGITLDTGLSFSEEALKKRLELRPVYEKFLDYMLRVLEEDGFIRRKPGAIEFLIPANQLPECESLHRSIQESHPDLSGLLDMLKHCARHYRAVLSGELSGVGVLLPDGSHEFLKVRLQPYADAYKHVRIYEQLACDLVLGLAAKQPLRILEVGAGGGDLTWQLAPRLAGSNCSYHFSDIGRTFVQQARKEAARRGLDFMSFGALDISKDPLQQGHAPESFDVILALNVVHATADVGETLTHLKKLLAPGGLVCLVELTHYHRWDHMIIGLAEGWWFYNDAFRKNSPLLQLDEWTEVFNRQGFAAVSALPCNSTDRSKSDAGLVVAQQSLSTSSAKSLQDNVQAANGSSPGSEPLELTPAQSEIWFATQMGNGPSCAYNDSRLLRFRGHVDMAALRHALAELVARHEALRVTFSPQGDLQFVHAHMAAELPFTDLSGLPEPQRQSRLQELEQREASQPFDLVRGPLFRAELVRLGSDEHVLLCTIHHLVCDGHSWAIVAQDLGELYSAKCAGRQANLTPALGLKEFVREQSRQRASGQSEAQEFWQKQFADRPEALELPTDQARPSSWNPEGARECVVLDSQLCRALKELSEEHRCTLFTTVLAIYYILLFRLTGQRDLLVGIPAADRTLPGSDTLVGHCVNFLPMRMAIDETPSFRHFLTHVREAFLAAYEHRHCTMGTLLQQIQARRDPSRIPLVAATFNLDRLREHIRFGALDTSLRLNSMSFSNFDLSLNVTEINGELHIDCRYPAALFYPETIRRWMGHFETLIRQIINRPDHLIQELSLMTEEARQQVLVGFNQTKLDYERDCCVPELFERQVERSPKSVAVSFKGQTFTYEALNIRANQLARFLQKSGVTPGAFVAVSLDRSLDLIVVILAILKAGAAYVPLDRSYPRERLAWMLKDSAAKLLVTDSAWDEIGAESVVRIDREHDRIAREATSNLQENVTSESIAYVIYTSGSTGLPKGAAIRHRSILRLVRNPNYTTLSPKDVFLQFAPISFDASTFEIWGCLLNGGKLVVFPPETPSLEELGQAIRREGVTILWLTAELFHQMVDHQLESLKGVRQLLAGGDVLSVSHVVKAANALPECRLINGYGPTENTTFTCCYPIPHKWSGARSVPIGRPISNTRVYLLDHRLEPVPIGVTGDLYAAGDGLMQGYLNRPEATAEKMIASPFPNLEAGKLYRTGDLARWQADGAIEFFGRADSQVKIRGHRIELGEIETALSAHPAVRAAVATLHEEGGSRRLVAYIVQKPESALLKARDLHKFLTGKLPTYMVPSAFAIIDEIPMTPSGKVDRRALASRPASRAENEASMAPRTDNERLLAEVWRDVLRVERVGVHDDFFELGGHSLLATQVISRIREAFQVEVPMHRFFERPTISALAEYVEQSPGIQGQTSTIRRRTPGSKAKALLARLDQLSDEEVEQLLEDPQFKNVLS